MKNLFATILLGFTLVLSAQEISYEDLQGLQKRPKGNFTTYISKDGQKYTVGEKVKLGTPQGGNKTFTYIFEGDGLLTPITPLAASVSGTETEIKSLGFGGTKRSGFFVWLRTKGITFIANYSINLENALAEGEVQTSGITSDEALEELKKAKDKLDLELITQDEYDSLKVELSKYIN